MDLQQQALAFYGQHAVLCWYLGVINLVAFVAYGVDKAKAVVGAWRIRESVLLGLAAAGGAAGAGLGMVLFRHKIRKAPFAIGVPLMLCAWVAVVLWLARA